MADIEITLDDLELCWPYRDTYLLEILNGTYSVESAREDILSLIGSKYDPRNEAYKERGREA